MSTTRSMITSSSAVQLDEKYFGETSKKSFVDTYRQLKKHGELLVGGYKELDTLISKPMEENVLAKSVADLKLAGVLTPRASLGNPPMRPDMPSPIMGNVTGKGRKMGFHLVDDDNEGTFLTKVGFSEDEDDHFDEERCPSLTPFGNPTVGLDSISELEASNLTLPMGEHMGLGMGSLDLSVTTAQSMAQDEEDEATAYTYRTQSPRAIFINGCLKNKIPPITIALVRRNLTSTINLNHMGIGDKIASILAGCLSSLPYLQVLNLADNNLTDVGLSELLISAAKHKELEELDISNNVVGIHASHALGAFIGNPGCKLQCLRLRDANIDDSECANICSKLKHNHYLKELDLSKNLLGKEENLNVVKPEFVTGGESLAELLLNKDCMIEKLVLHWNMIRLDGALALCNAIHLNKHLTYLDLSYNAIGSAGAEILGKSLLDNTTLQTLLVGHNSINAVGCFTMCVGIAENATLTDLIFDGNPLGAQGCMILTLTVLSSSPNLKITAKSCDFQQKQESMKFDINDCAGSYVLDMTVPFQRATLIAILRLYAVNTSITIKSLEMPAEGGRAGVLELYTVSRESVERSIYSAEDRQELEELVHLSHLNALSSDQITQAAKEYDLEDLDRFDTGMLINVLADLGLHCSDTLLLEMKQLLDPFQYQFIEIRGLCLYLYFLGEKAVAMAQDLRKVKKTFIESAHTPGKVEFSAPHRGTVKITVLEAFAQTPLEGNSPRLLGMTHRKCQRVIDAAHRATNSLQIMQCALVGAIFYIEEAKLFFTHLFALIDDPVAAVAMLLPHMASSYDANLLIKCCLGYDMKKIRRLQQKLGPLYGPVTGIYNGYYSIDFSDPLSRQCWKMLLAKSLEVKNRRKYDNFGEISQNGDGIFCFRNIHIVKSLPVPVAAMPAGSSKAWDVGPTAVAERDAILAPLMEVSTIPKSGKIEFDFTNATLPDLTSFNASIHTLSDDSFIRILNACQLLDDRDIDTTLDRLLHLMKASRKMSLANGRSYWVPSLAHAIATGDKLFELYSNLPTRKRSIESVSKRESLEVDTSTEPKHVHLKAPASLRVRLSDAYEYKRSAKAERYIQKFLALLATKAHSVRLVSKNTWINRIRHIMLDAHSSAEFKSANLGEYLTAELVHRWIYCRQLAVLVQLYTFGKALYSEFGSYRVELIVKLFDRIVDLHNIQFVLMHLSAHEHAALQARIGILNMFNPCCVAGGFQLDMSRWDERQVVKMLIHLSTVEPGENFLDEEYSFDRNHVPMPGWELKITWFQEDSLPRKGVLSLEVYSGEGMNMNECSAHRSTRNMMMALVLPKQRDLYDEISLDIATSTILTSGVASAFSVRENRLEYTPQVPRLSRQPSEEFAKALSRQPSQQGSQAGSVQGSQRGSHQPSQQPSHQPSQQPSPHPSQQPSQQVSRQGSVQGSLLESCECSVATTSDVVLYDPGMQLLHAQLELFEGYETGDRSAVPPPPGKGNTPKAAKVKVDETPVVVPGVKQTGGDSKFMKTYRLDDLHTNLRTKTNISWTYAVQSAKTGSRATSRNGT